MELPTVTSLPFQARIRKPAYFDAMRRHGCHSFGVYNRTYVALGFHDPITEYWDLLNGVVLWPVAGERQVEITGPDAKRFVQLLTPRNLENCPPGRCRYVLVTADDGGIVNDPVCLCLGENHFWLSAADSDLLLYALGVNAVAKMDVHIRDPNVSVLQIQGPRSVGFVRELIGSGIDSLRYYRCGRYRVAGIDVVVSRTGWSNEWGYEIYLLDEREGDRLFDYLIAAGEPHGLRLGVVSQIRRIEAGMLSYGADFDLTTNPFELGLGRLVDLDQPADFIGKAALRAFARRAPARQLVGVRFEGEPVSGFIRPWDLCAGDVLVGAVTSLCHSPRVGANIGLALVPALMSKAGTKVTLKTPRGDLSGLVCDLPFTPSRTSRPG